MQLHRIAKFIAHSGYCSRRAAEKLIVIGNVKVDEKIITECATLVSDKNVIKINNQPLPQFPKARLWLYHKPKGVITTHSDPYNRRTVFADLSPDIPKVISIGRLDFNTEGLLLLTNNRPLAHYLEHSKNRLLRKYKCRAFGHLKDADIAQLSNGITIDQISYGSIKVEVLKKQGHNVWLIVELCEGKNREVRKALEHLGLKVNRLIRIQYGKFHLNEIQKSGTIEVEDELFSEYLYESYRTQHP